MLEKQIEAKAKRYCQNNGIMFLKFVSPGTRGVPDRLLIGPHGNIAFIEFKRKGEEPSPLQRAMLDKLSKRRCFASYVDSYKKAVVVINNFLAWDRVR